MCECKMYYRIIADVDLQQHLSSAITGSISRDHTCDYTRDMPTRDHWLTCC